MATRKIRLTMSGTQANGQGPIIDVDFNNENLDTDIDVNAVYGTATIVKEYTVDVAAGTYGLDITYKNDVGGDEDRNFYIEKIELANDSVNYETFLVTSINSNLEEQKNFNSNGYDMYHLIIGDDGTPLLNADYNESLPRTDKKSLGYQDFTDPGNNPKYQYEYIKLPVKIWSNETATFNITFS